MNNTIFLLVTPTEHVEKIKTTFPVFNYQAKESNPIYTQFLLCFQVPQDEMILEQMLAKLDLGLYFLDPLF